MNKSQLYESIMKKVAKEVKEELNLIDFGDNKIQKSQKVPQKLTLDEEIKRQATIYDDVLKKEYDKVQNYIKTWDLKQHSIRHYVTKDGYANAGAYAGEYNYYFYGPSRLFQYRISLKPVQLKPYIIFDAIDENENIINRNSDINQFKDKFILLCKQENTCLKIKKYKTNLENIQMFNQFYVDIDDPNYVSPVKFNTFDEAKQYAYKITMEIIQDGKKTDLARYFENEPYDITNGDPYYLLIYRYYQYGNSLSSRRCVSVTGKI